METDLLEISRALYRAGMDAGDWPEALVRLGEAVGAAACVVARHDTATDTAQVLHASGVDPMFVAGYGTDGTGSSACRQHKLHLSVVPAMIDSREAVSAADFEAGAFYCKWLEPQGLRDTLFVVIDRVETATVVVQLSRSAGLGPFTAMGRQILQALTIDLHRSFEIGKTLTRSRQTADLLLTALDALPLAFALVNAKGHVLVANAPARELIAKADGIRSVNGALVTNNSGQWLRMRDLVARVQAAEATSTERLLPVVVNRSAGRPLAMLVAAVLRPDDLVDGAAAMLFIGDPDAVTPFDHARVAKLYGLSRAESRVAALLATGYRLDQTGEMLGVAYETVRKHVKEVLGKTGTFRQVELVRILLNGPAGLQL
jgi:DNA-binding CsgD family transcriptional regulator